MASELMSQNSTEHTKQEQLAPSQAELVKHPLQHSWTLWYFEPDRNKSWEDNQNKVSTFNTVEDFWSLFTHIKQPSEVKIGSDYSLFKEHIRPMWEDKANKNGGRWMITLVKNQRPELDRYWIDTVLCLIGEAFDSFDDVCGAVVNIRAKGDKIAVWTGNSNNKDAVMEIGRKLKEGLNLPERVKIQYQTHSDSMVKNSSNIKSMYEI
ncbi:eukaryotic translation initiation factor 4E1 isoform X2 [Chironomus tepperi]|uniref:eukaryotic translation initiation factor 4E1 isoform X2 n=1 Tax=Chironomus tepperi TaxID=113505 RepID=UPI00391F7383